MRVRRDREWLEAVAGRLVATRQALGVRDADLAATAEVTVQAWSNYINAIRPLDVEAASRICDRHNLTLDWLYRGILAGLPHELADKLAPRTTSRVIPLRKR